MKKVKKFSLIVSFTLFLIVNLFFGISIDKDFNVDLNQLVQQSQAQTEDPYGNDLDGRCEVCTYWYGDDPVDGIIIVCFASMGHYCDPYNECTLGFC